MSFTTNPNSISSLKKFSAALSTLVLRETTDFTSLCGEAPKQTGKDAMSYDTSSPAMPGVWIRDLSQKKVGDRVTYDAVDSLTGEPIMGDEIREGKGESTEVDSMEIRIDRSSKAVKGRSGAMDDQRSAIDKEGVAMANLRAYWPRLMSNRVLFQCAGARGEQTSKTIHVPLQGDPTFTKKMINPVMAPTFNRHLVVDNVSGIVQGCQQLGSIESADVFKLSTIDTFVEWLDSQDFQTLRIKGDKMSDSDPVRGVLYLDPAQFAQLIGDSSGQNTIRNWQATAQKRASYSEGSPLFQGECYMWNGILFRKMKHSVCFSAGSTVKGITQANRYTATETDIQVNPAIPAGYRVSRALFLTGQAFAIALGANKSSGVTANIKTRTYDFDDKSEIMGEWMGGEAKLRFKFRDSAGNLEPTDFGVTAIDSITRVMGV